MSLRLKARLTKLEQRRENTPEPFRVIIAPCIGVADLARSTCRRTLCAGGELIEYVQLNGSRESVSDEDLERFIASFPVEPAQGL